MVLNRTVKLYAGGVARGLEPHAPLLVTRSYNMSGVLNIIIIRPLVAAAVYRVFRTYLTTLTSF